MFTNFMSLGSSCHTASSMSKYGLRSFAGPFDWLITGNLEWVLYYIENDFEGFLEKENLECWKNDHRKFVDKKNGFLFLHDVVHSFENEYKEYKMKYEKRIIRFLKEIEKPTCFVRFLTDLEEVKYISKNFEYINRVIKKKNSQNEIIFIIETDQKIFDTILFRHYVIPQKKDENSYPLYEQLRGKFDGINDFLEYCAENYNSVSMMRNIIFDSKKEGDHKIEVQ